MSGNVIVVPAQANDVNAFHAVAQKIGGTIVWARMTVPDQSAVSEVALVRASDRAAFSFKPGMSFDAFMILSHIGLCDGPNINYYAPGDPRAFQPWGQEGVGQLTQRGLSFWQSVGAALNPNGKILLLGCKSGVRGCKGGNNCWDNHNDVNGTHHHDGFPAATFAQLVSNASGRVTFGARGPFGAGDVAKCLPPVRNILRNGGDSYFNTFRPGASARASSEQRYAGAWGARPALAFGRG
jgi:hypothetical protein